MPASKRDRARLRALAGRYAACALSGTMAVRREKWRRHNRLEEKTFPFHIEDNGSYLKDLAAPPECADETALALEARLLAALTAWENIDDDRVIPARFVVDWVTPVSDYCDRLEFTHADDGRGHALGYRSSRPLRDIEADWDRLKKRSALLERVATERMADLAREAFRALLPVEIGRPGTFYSSGVTNRAVHLVGMQELYLQMAAGPAAVHRLLGFLADDNLALGRWEEEQGLLTLNHDGNQGYCSGSSFISDETAAAAGERVLSTDRFGYLESQESAGLSPAMFEEFVMPHLVRLAARFKLLMFGCCEPVHGLMPALLRLPNLRKVSVTPWCDLRRLAETCPRSVAWCRKPVPLKLCGPAFAPDDLRAHLQETMAIGRGWFIEFVCRDTNLLTGAMRERVARACALIRELTGRPEGSRRE